VIFKINIWGYQVCALASVIVELLVILQWQMLLHGCHDTEHNNASAIMLNVTFYLLLSWMSLCWVSWRRVKSCWIDKFAFKQPVTIDCITQISAQPITKARKFNLTWVGLLNTLVGLGVTTECDPICRNDCYQFVQSLNYS
jgi:hypothetical protein